MGELMFNVFIDGKKCSILHLLKVLGLLRKISLYCFQLRKMVLKNGLLLLTIFLEEQANSVERDGIIILILKSRRRIGALRKNGHFSYSIERLEINGQRQQRYLKVGLIIRSRIIGIHRCKRKLRIYEENLNKRLQRKCIEER